MALKGALYFIDLQECYKFGVSTYPQRRYKDYNREFGGVPKKPLFEIHFENQEDAYQLESELKHRLKEYKAGIGANPNSVEYTMADADIVSTTILEINSDYIFSEPNTFVPNIRISGENFDRQDARVINLRNKANFEKAYPKKGLRFI